MNNFIDEFQRLQILEIEIEKLTGYNLEELRILFAQGYTLKEPALFKKSCGLNRIM